MILLQVLEIITKSICFFSENYNAGGVEKMSNKKQAVAKKTFVVRMLDVIETVGNKLPDPFMLFALLTLAVILASALLSWMGVSVEDPRNPGEVLTVMNLLSAEGIEYMFSSLVSNFTGFAPLGSVLVIMLGIGIMEQTGLLGTSLRALVMAVPEKMITATLIFASVMASIAADAGYVVLVPLGAALFIGMGRHPLAGLTAAFAGVSGGFSANLMITSLDPLLGGITEMALEPFAPDYNFNVAGNLFFMAASVFLITIIGTLVTEKIVEPRLGTYKGDQKAEVEELTDLEKRGMKLAGIALLITVGLLSLLVVPEWGPLRGDGDIVSSPFFTHLVAVLLIAFLVPGLVYGIVTKKITKSSDVSKQFSDTMASMSSFIVLAFIAGQFVAFFTQTNLGMILAVSGAELLKNIGLTGFPLVVVFMIICGFINLFIGSASAKWALMAPVFVPIMMQLGFTPEFTQLTYRIADSATNVISPLMTYFALVVAFAQKYDKKMGLGTLISTMLPFSIAFFLGWILMLFGWMLLDLPIGPGTGIWL